MQLISTTKVVKPINCLLSLSATNIKCKPGNQSVCSVYIDHADLTNHQPSKLHSLYR